MTARDRLCVLCLWNIATNGYDVSMRSLLNTPLLAPGIGCTLLLTFTACTASGPPEPIADTASHLTGCPTALEQINHGTVQPESLSEVSGIASSRTHPELLWLHNDSGHPAELLGTDLQGSLVSTIRLTEEVNLDWEDLVTTGLEEQPKQLEVADIGDNLSLRPQVTLLRIPEPTQLDATLTVEDVETLTLTYPNGPRNAEALLFDPFSQEFIVITKSLQGESEVYTTPWISSAAPQPLVHVGALSFGAEPLPGNPMVTGGDISPQGHFIAIRTYSHIFLWFRDQNESVIDTLVHPPCFTVSYPELQGESIAFSSDGTSLFSVSEGSHQPIVEFQGVHG